MDYIALARKYRSGSFDQVVGQQAIAATLANAVKTGRIAQAYLFTGTRGVGKTTMARILAKALNCLAGEGPTPTPCNKCDACMSIARGEDMDVLEIDGASNRGIDEIRELRSSAGVRPARARFKIYYIDEVHMLTKEAWNALLKTLEEPPAHVRFIFATTEAAKIPATILSRCQRFDFRNIPTADIDRHLKAICGKEKIEIDDDAVFRIAKAGAGSMRDAISLLDQLVSSTPGPLTEADVLRVLGTPPEERIGELAGAIAAGDAATALGKLDEILLAGYPLEGVASALAEQFRYVMLALACGAGSPLIELSESGRAALGELAKGYTLSSAVHAVGVCEQLMRSVRSSSFARALAEAAVVRLASADKFVDPASLVQRLEQLAGGTTRGASGAGPATRPPGAPGGNAWGAKKKPLTVPHARADGPGTSPAKAATTKPQAESLCHPGGPVRWEAAWLAANWPAMVERVSAAGFPAVAGLLQAAKPLSAGAGTIRLGYPADQASIRARAAGTMAAPLARAMSALAGRPVQCELVSLGEPAGRPGIVGGQHIGGISSEQRRQVEQDPAVRAIAERFGGQISGIRPDRELARAAPASQTGQPADGPEPAEAPEEAG